MKKNGNSTTAQAASIMGKIGGSVRSEAKRKANRKKARNLWKEVRAGERPMPAVGRKPKKKSNHAKANTQESIPERSAEAA